MGSWFGMLQTLYCTHRSDRLYFVGLTQQHHHTQARKLTNICAGTWKYSFDKTSIHYRRDLQLELKDWELPRE